MVRTAPSLGRIAVHPEPEPRAGTSVDSRFDAVAEVPGRRLRPDGTEMLRHDPTTDRVYVMEVDAAAVRVDRHPGYAKGKPGQAFKHLLTGGDWKRVSGAAELVYIIITQHAATPKFAAYIAEVRDTVQAGLQQQLGNTRPTVYVVHRRIGI